MKVTPAHDLRDFECGRRHGLPEVEVMDKHGKKFEPVIYPGAGHAFMRLGEEANPTEANRKARDESWERLLLVLRALQ